jgi:hypothetical protein
MMSLSVIGFLAEPLRGLLRDLPEGIDLPLRRASPRQVGSPDDAIGAQGSASDRTGARFLKHRAAVEAAFPIRLMLPSEPARAVEEGVRRP